MWRTVIIVGWIWGLAALPSRSPAPLPGLGRALFWILLVSHAMAAVAGYETLREAPGSLASHVGRTLLWGNLHLREIVAGEA